MLNKTSKLFTQIARRITGQIARQITGHLVGAVAAITVAMTAAPARADLIQSVWHNIPYYEFLPSDSTISAEQAWAAGNAAAYSFTNTNASFQYNSSAQTIGGFFAADAAGAALTDFSPTQAFAFNAVGFIYAAVAGTYTFDFGNTFDRIDDAARLTIDGNIVAEQHFNNGVPLDFPYAVSLTLSQGYHAFDLFYFQTIGGWGLNLFSSGPDGAPITYTTTAEVPAPGALALLGFGLVGLGAMRRRKSA